MQYSIDYLAAATKVIQKLPRDTQRRILSQIEKLTANPRPPGSIKLTGQDAYRLRLGSYRVIYSIFNRRLLIVVIDVGHRREVYRRM